jgi:hypothetical protein
MLSAAKHPSRCLQSDLFFDKRNDGFFAGAQPPLAALAGSEWQKRR